MIFTWVGAPIILVFCDGAKKTKASAEISELQMNAIVIILEVCAYENLLQMMWHFDVIVRKWSFSTSIGIGSNSDLMALLWKYFSWNLAKKNI